jgi:hypothetical protein
MIDTILEGRRLTQERFERREREGPITATPLGRRQMTLFVEPLAEIIAYRLRDRRKLPRGDLGRFMRQLAKVPASELATITLGTVMHAIDIRSRNVEASASTMERQIARHSSHAWS